MVTSGFADAGEVIHQLFLSTKDRSRAAAELRRCLPTLGYPHIQTIPFFSDESTIGGVVAIYSHLHVAKLQRIKRKLAPVLNEASIIVDFVIDRFLQKELLKVNEFGLKNDNFRRAGWDVPNGGAGTNVFSL